MFDHATMQKRFWELTRKREEIAAQAGPLRAERDALIAKHTAEVQPLEAKIKQVEAPLFDIDRERGLIARALGGKTGAPQ